MADRMGGQAVAWEGPGSDEGALTDEELTELALAADPDAVLGDDAVPMSWYLLQVPTSLPQWYMPPAMARAGSRWRVPVVLAVVGAFLIIDALGLCSTYGALSFA